MELVEDTILTWTGWGHSERNLPEQGNWESRCRLRIYRHEGGSQVVVLTQSYDEDSPCYNGGTSITNASENVATLVVNRYGLDPERVTFIEHYIDRTVDPDDPLGPETFDLIEYDWSGWIAKSPPRWSHLGRERAEDLVGVSL
ncbi:MAG: hypothetical protein ABEL51_03670 [Salinibacter sp.]